MARSNKKAARTENKKKKTAAADSVRKPTPAAASKQKATPRAKVVVADPAVSKALNGKTKKSIPIHINFAFGLGFFILVLAAYKKMPGYTWAFDTLVGNNLETINKYPDLTIEEKYAAKLTFDYQYLKIVKDNTPEDAVVLFPPTDFIKQVRKQNKALTASSVGMYNSRWAEYFIYPRQIVYEPRADDPKADSLRQLDRYKNATHVAVLSNWGLHKLSYRPQLSSAYTVVPITPPAATKTEKQ